MSFADAAVASRDMTASVRRALHHSGYSALRSIHVAAIGDDVHLSGVVSTYYLKQLAQSIAMQTCAASVFNHVEVL